MRIIAIDPGNFESAYVIADSIDLKPLDFGKIPNYELLDKLRHVPNNYHIAIEMIASYGMAVGLEVFETVFWIGQFWEATNKLHRTRIYRKDIKMHLCETMKAKDCNIRQALIDRFGEVGTKNNQGFFYGFKADIWQAFAVLVTYYDLNNT
jgi:hypothetical protein